MITIKIGMECSLLKIPESISTGEESFQFALILCWPRNAYICVRLSISYGFLICLIRKQLLDLTFCLCANFFECFSQFSFQLIFFSINANLFGLISFVFCVRVTFEFFFREQFSLIRRCRSYFVRFLNYFLFVFIFLSLL